MISNVTRILALACTTLSVVGCTQHETKVMTEPVKPAPSATVGATGDRDPDVVARDGDVDVDVDVDRDARDDGDDTVRGDNSKRNAAIDVDAFDQGSSDGDVETTRAIREAVVDDGSLSTYAHNVKIITRDGHVVLKGPVRSAVEKQRVEQYARDIAGATAVTSALVVTP
jgi:hypothetical protein